MKVAFSLKGEDLEGKEQVFQKPWFMTFMMFLAMSFALPFDTSLYCPDRLERRGDSSPKGPSWSRKVGMVAAPALFDILATGLCSMGFLYIPASVWQLLRGAEMIFAACFAAIFLRKRIYSFHWYGVGLCTIGIFLVGLASVLGADAQPQNADKSKEQSLRSMLIGISLALSGQVVQAAQVVGEEYLLRECDLPGMQVVGFEGIWGMLFTWFTVFPILLWIPGDDHGHLEDAPETVHMIFSNQYLLSFLLIYLFSCATYNMSGIAVTGALSAVHRVMLEAFRTSFVWAFGLGVHYFVNPESSFGEAWTIWSWLEVVGFVVIMYGQAVYGEMIRVSWFHYPEDVDIIRSQSPGEMLSLTSPLPPLRVDHSSEGPGAPLLGPA
eukprot:CAMPEP_0206449370 /NCGR_PEP_ID=MMETSP0324_2-20121206/18048_1 /ASSEMBLY_ACC=CAM_ASM_000836 /TAXON_ID=2866 /ORGANISM="Crypthecodinium cohnii, Strain Seligo" /LENGTH=380 /DNA_ID=CAMNT_0053918733 /DNA_START=177 /DNA_END=1319 /DNA_ORIENTATION=-